MSSIEKQRKYWESCHEGISEETRVVLNHYLLYLQQANRSEATIAKYKWILEQYLSYCKVPLEAITSEHVLQWLNDNLDGKSQKTKELYHVTLNVFFNFCLAEGVVDKVLVKKRWRPKIPPALPKFLTDQEYARVKRKAEQLSTRNRALVLFLFSSGCRKSEVIGLTIQDVDINRRTAKVTGKGKRIRTVHFSEECALVLREYLRTRSSEPEGPLFLNKFKGPLKTTGIRLVLKKLGEEAGLSTSLHPHKCRHTFATRMLARGADLLFLASELGHVNPNTTRVYARIPTEDLKMVYDNKMR